MIMALMGYEADASDMMETGLATNFMESPKQTLGIFERTLAEIPPWNQQALVKKPIRFYGQPDLSTVASASGLSFRALNNDNNAQFRNVAVADAVHCFSSYRADGGDMWDTKDEDDYDERGSRYLLEDPSLETDPLSWHVERSSDLVDYAATFNDIFVSETTMPGILERFREISARQSMDPEEQEGIDVAADFVKRLERQSPLAVSVVHRLLQIGGTGVGEAKTTRNSYETLETCMTREYKAQSKLLQMEDFQQWAKYNTKLGSRKEKGASAPFSSWKHESFDQVSRDEVDEILEL